MTMKDKEPKILEKTVNKEMNKHLVEVQIKKGIHKLMNRMKT